MSQSSSTQLEDRRAVVLLSGGLDSATVLAFAQRDGFECHALSFDYGQRHRYEIEAAARIAKEMNAVSHRTVTLDLRPVGGSALTSDIPVPKGRSHEEMAKSIPVTYVPARNLIFLSVAAAFAETLGADHIFIGVNAIDFSGYPDCRPEFIAAFQEAARLATRVGVERRGVQIETPLMNLKKWQIIQLGASLNVDYSLSQSCYDPQIDDRGQLSLACGQCDACLLRREGFQQAGISDPTRYAASAHTIFR